MADLVTLDEAIRLVLENTSPLGTETVALDAAAGRVMTQPATAATDLPPFPSSAMDGYAVRAADTPGRLPISARVAAGLPPSAGLGLGTAVEISTGGVVPDGADAVVPLERVDVADGVVVIDFAVTAGDNVRDRGRDIRSGEVVVPAGTRLEAAQIGALAAAGVGSVVCGRRPRVAVITTGTELRDPGTPLAAGEIYESNGRMLAALLTQEGATVERIGMVADDLDAHAAAIREALSADVLVTSGGVSVGPHDLVRQTLTAAGFEEVFWGISVRPGKPVSFGRRGRTLVFGLPGNPVASLVGGLLLVAPALRRLQGDTAPETHPLVARLAATTRRNAARDDLLRGHVAPAGDSLVFTPITGQESHMIVRASRANAICRLRRGDEDAPAGTPVDVYLLGRAGP
jgi:molybdopterin molybdotransferase